MSWFKDTFGPSTSDIWKEVAKEMGGEFINEGFWASGKVKYNYKKWTIVMDTFTPSESSTRTRISSEFLSESTFSFRIYEENVFSSVSKFIGLQDIQICYEPFDSTYMIKGNDEEKVKFLLNSTDIRRAIQKEDNIRLETGPITSIFGKNTGRYQIHFETIGAIKDKERIKSLFALFCLLHDRLEDTGI